MIIYEGYLRVHDIYGTRVCEGQGSLSKTITVIKGETKAEDRKISFYTVIINGI